MTLTSCFCSVLFAAVVAAAGCVVVRVRDACGWTPLPGWWAQAEQQSFLHMVGLEDPLAPPDGASVVLMAYQDATEREEICDERQGEEN